MGVVLRRYRFLDEGFIDAANSLVYYILLPALLFYEIGGTDFRQAFSGPLVAGGYVATIATFLLAFLVARVLGLGPSETGVVRPGVVPLQPRLRRAADRFQRGGARGAAEGGDLTSD